MTADVSRLLGALALVLAFGALAAGRLRAVVYAAQCAAIGAAALWAVPADPESGSVALLLGVQLWWLWPALRVAGAASRPAVPAAGAGLLLVVVAVACAPAGVVAPLAIVLLGLLAAAAAPGPFGPLTVLNGAALALVEAHGLPLTSVLAAGLAALAVVVATEGRMMVRR